MCRMLVVAVGLFVATASSARAQTDFSTVKLRVGDSVFVKETPDVEMKGRVVALSPTRLELDNGWTFTPESTLKIDRRGDPPWNGLITGAIAGALVTAAAGAGETSTASLLVGGAVLWGGIGLAIDLDHTGRTTVFRQSPSLRVAPTFTSSRRGVSVSLSF